MEVWDKNMKSMRPSIFHLSYDGDLSWTKPVSVVLCSQLNPGSTSTAEPCDEHMLRWKDYWERARGRSQMPAALVGLHQWHISWDIFWHERTTGWSMREYLKYRVTGLERIIKTRRASKKKWKNTDISQTGGGWTDKEWTGYKMGTVSDRLDYKVCSE